MKGSQVIIVFGLVISLIAITAVNGFRFYDIFEPRAARWPRRDAISANPMFPNGESEEQKYVRIISYLNDVGKRRR